LLDRDPARYAPETRFSFTQVYLGADSPEIRKAGEAALARIRQGASPGSVAQPIPVPADYSKSAASEIAGVFGDGFVAALRQQPLGTWSGPVASGVGLHLVKVTARTAAAKPALADVRQALENDWRADALRRAEDASYRRILAGYDVVIEQPR
jgi:hypothetical protein